VEGQGYPTVAPGSSGDTYMRQTWANWGGLLQAACDKYKFPVAWALAVATMETGFLSKDPTKQAQAQSPVGAIGVMQIMPFNATNHGLTDASELYDPAKNIGVGVQMLAKSNENATYGGLPGIAAIYNSGKLCSTGRNEWNLLADSDYPLHV